MAKKFKYGGDVPILIEVPGKGYQRINPGDTVESWDDKWMKDNGFKLVRATTKKETSNE